MLGKEKSGLVTGLPLELLGENGSRLRASQGTGSGAGEWIYDLLSQHHTDSGPDGETCWAKLRAGELERWPGPGWQMSDARLLAAAPAPSTESGKPEGWGLCKGRTAAGV